MSSLQAELEQVLVQFSKELAIVQGEYNAGTQKLSITQAHAEQTQERAFQAILATVSKHLPEKKDTTIYKGSYTLDEMDDPINNTHGLAYCNGRNTAITEMEKKLTPADKE